MDVDAAPGVEVRLWAAARAAAGTDLLTVAPGPLAAVLRAVLDGRPARLAEVLARCSLLLDGVAVHDDDVTVPAGSCLDVLPPFAGG